MDVNVGVRVVRREKARAAGVIEVDVGQRDDREFIPSDADVLEGLAEQVVVGADTGVDDGGRSSSMM